VLTLSVRVVEHEQHGKEKAGYGEELPERLASDLSAKFGRDFSVYQLRMIRQFHLLYRDLDIRQSVIG
jgi:hypothetical protein